MTRNSSGLFVVCSTMVWLASLGFAQSYTMSTVGAGAGEVIGIASLGAGMGTGGGAAIGALIPAGG